MSLANTLHEYFDVLAEKSWVLIPFDRQYARELLEAAQNHLENYKAGTTPLAGRSAKPHREDRIFWLEPSKLNPSEHQTELRIWSDLQYLRQELKDYFRLPLHEIECHFAYYRPGGAYVKHRDSTQIDNKRVFSFVIYLNSNWQNEHGGQLVGYDENEQPLFEILPQAGAMVLFKSELLHEVMPCTQTRFTLTGWIRR